MKTTNKSTVEYLDHRVLKDYIDLAYLAGAMEADGCWFIADSTSMRLTNKSIKLLQWCIDNFGGKVSSKSSPINCYEWTLHGVLAEDLTRKVQPYLKSKCEEVSIWLEYRKTITTRGCKLSQEVLKLRETLKENLVKARARRNGEND